MKKLSLFAICMLGIMLVVSPLMAADLEIGGSCEANGFYMNNTDLDDDTGASDAFMDMKLSLDMIFKVTDKLKLVTAADIFEDKVWGHDPDPACGIEWKKAYIAAKFDYFNLHVGRMGRGIWGPDFGNIDEEADKIKVFKKIGNFKITAAYTKHKEGDKGEQTDKVTGNPLWWSDSDKDTYGVNVKYASEKYNAGFKVRYLRDMSNSDANPYTDTANLYKYSDVLVTPYLIGSFGPVDIEAEIAYKHGEKDFYNKQDIDKRAWEYYVNAAFNAGPVNLSAGYAFVEGNDVNDKSEDSAFGYCTEFQPLIILFNDKVGGDLGGLGNLNKDGAYSKEIKNAGYKLLYATASFSPVENVTLNAAIGTATADEQKPGWDDDYGVEYNLGVEVGLMDNLTYSATFGYLSAGDFWKQGPADKKVDNTYAFMHSLVVEF